MKHVLTFILLLISTLVFANQSSLASATINGQSFTVGSSKCVTFAGGTNLPISVTFKQISNYSGNVDLTVNVLITDQTNKTVSTVPNVFLMYNISASTYTVNLAPVNLNTAHLYSFKFDAIVAYPHQSDANSNNKSSITTCPNVLPVELAYFNGSVSRGVAKLVWVTSLEKNSDYFVIESSRDGFTFVTRGQVSAAGSSAQQRSYNFSTSIEGETYFRLKSVDADGSFTYSPLLLLHAGPRMQYLVGYGERFISFNLLTDDAPVKLSVLDFSGRVLYEVDATHTLPMQPENLVILRLVTKSGMSYSKRY